MNNSVVDTKTLEDFDKDLDQRHMRGQWQYDVQLEAIKRDGPASAGVPFLWTWDLVESTLHELRDLLPPENTARRNVSFINPGVAVTGTSHTLLMGMQMVLPGEIAWAHRHSINALRFVVDGSHSLYTVVDGEKCIMETNDLVLTPAYTWHDHHNESDQPKIWIDILDVPVLGFLRQFFFETYSENIQPVRGGQRRSGDVRDLFGSGSLTASAAMAGGYRYAWSDVRKALLSGAETDASLYDDVILRYANPVTGESTLPTLDCSVQLLRPEFSGKEHRTTSSAVYYVIEGEGTTVVGDREINWGPRDSFVIPNWMWHRHLNRSTSSEAVLFRTSDAPLLRKLGMYRQEPLGSFDSHPYPAAADSAQHRKDAQ